VSPVNYSLLVSLQILATPLPQSKIPGYACIPITRIWISGEIPLDLYES